MRKRAVCGMCQGGCDVVVTIEDGRIVRVAADGESERGRLCARGAFAAEALYGEQRIMHPMVRDAETGELVCTSWDEALDRTAELIRAVVDDCGPQAMASYFGRGVLGTPVMRLGGGRDSLLSRIGSQNDMNCASICFLSSNVVVPVSCMGLPAANIVADVEHSDVIVVWGQNPATEEGPQLLLRDIKRAQARGAQLVVVDPRREGIGDIADRWIPIKPGADGALAMALLKRVVESERYDAGFVGEFTEGFDDLAHRVSQLDESCLSELCGVPREDIAWLFELITSTVRASLIVYTGIEYQRGAVAAGRALWTLWAITGKLDVEGGMYLDAFGARGRRMHALSSGPPPLGAREFPLFYAFRGEGQFCCMPQAVLEDDPYPVRGLLVVGGSPACSFPEGDTWRAVYERLDCLVVIDRFFTEETRFADVVLPAASLYEVPRLRKTPAGAEALARVVAPAGDARSDVLILSDIARRLGVGEGLPHDEGEYAIWLEKSAYSSEPRPRAYEKFRSGALRADGAPGFPTESGKFEICSRLLEAAGFESLPSCASSLLQAERRQRFPFVLTTGARSNNRMGVYGANIPVLAALEPEPLVEVSSGDASALEVGDGDLVRVVTPYGRCVYRVRIAPMARGAVHVPHGGGSAFMPDAWRDACPGALTSLGECDDITGFPLIKAVPCRIERVE